MATKTWTEKMNAWNATKIPILDCDKQSNAVNKTGLIERQAVAMLLDMLIVAGFEIDSVFDGDEAIKAASIKAAMETVFSVDESTIRMKVRGSKTGMQYGIFVVCGNGFDCISDYSAGDGNTNRLFDETIKAFYDLLPG